MDVSQEYVDLEFVLLQPVREIRFVREETLIHMILQRNLTADIMRESFRTSLSLVLRDVRITVLRQRKMMSESKVQRLLIGKRKAA